AEEKGIGAGEPTDDESAEEEPVEVSDGSEEVTDELTEAEEDFPGIEEAIEATTDDGDEDDSDENDELRGTKLQVGGDEVDVGEMFEKADEIIEDLE
ncbi:MAG: hypothetical protein SV760_02630, partial [Halobacteria archaeon]|nr:hypothetical protein [Halobacteria archaeon]